MKHESPNQLPIGKLSDTAEHRLNKRIMKSALWAIFNGDEIAERARYAKLDEEMRIRDQEMYDNAVREGRYKPLFGAPYDQATEPETVVARMATDAETDLPKVVDLATHRAKKLLEATPDTDQEDRSDIA